MTSQWEDIVRHQLFEDTWNFYNHQNFPVKIRMICTSKLTPAWIENTVHEIQSMQIHARSGKIVEFHSKVFQGLEAFERQLLMRGRKTQNVAWLEEGLRFQMDLRKLKDGFRNPEYFYKILEECLRHEKTLLDSRCISGPSSLNSQQIVVETDRTQKQQNYRQVMEQIAQLNWNLPPSRDLFHQLEQLRNVTFDLLNNWQLEQRRALNGASMSHNLDPDYRTGSILGISDIVKTLGNGLLHSTIVQGEQNQFNTLLQRSFVLESQPVQILYTSQKNKISMVARLIMGEIELLKNARISIDVEALIIEKSEAIKVYDNPNYVPVPAHNNRRFGLSNNTRLMKYDGLTGHLIADFDVIELTKGTEEDSASEEGRKRFRSKSGSQDEPVPQRKYYFYVRVKKFIWGEQDLTHLKIFTLSAPIIVSASPNSNDASWATILWDNAFSCFRNPMEETKKVPPPGSVRQEVKADDLLDAISHSFRKDCGRELSTRNKEFLKQKLLGKTDVTVTWNHFFGHILQNCIRPEAYSNKLTPPSSEEEPSKGPATATATPPSIKFITWLHTIKKMCTPRSNKPGVAKCWRDGHIQGFEFSENIEENLKSCEEGAFVIYFSQILLGGLTIAFYDHRGGKLNKLSPVLPATFTFSDGLERRLHDQKMLKKVYLGRNGISSQAVTVPKNKAFPYSEDDEGLSPMQWYLWHHEYIQLRQKMQQLTILSAKDSHPGPPLDCPLMTSRHNVSYFGGQPYAPDDPHQLQSNPMTVDDIAYLGFDAGDVSFN